MHSVASPPAGRDTGEESVDPACFCRHFQTDAALAVASRTARGLIKQIFSDFRKIFGNFATQFSERIVEQTNTFVTNAIWKCNGLNRFLKNFIGVDKSRPASPADTEAWRVAVVRESVVSQQRLIAIIHGDLRHVCGAARRFCGYRDFIAPQMTDRLPQSAEDIP